MNDLPLGAWLTLIATGLSIGAVLIKFGEMKADARNLREKMNDELADIRQSVAAALKDLNTRMDEILDFIHDSQQQRITDARWQENTTGSISAVAKDALEARELAKLSLSQRGA
jgi:phage host-nuclease inhibitor protein Gam